MKRNYFQTISLTLVAAVGLTACSGLGKLAKNADEITYKVTPDPMEMKGDSITITVSGTFPEKTFPKKAKVTTIPTIIYNGGQVELNPIVLRGSSVEGSETQIDYVSGGSFSYTSNKVAYIPEMQAATLELQATGQVKKKTKALDAMKVADGTIITSLLLKNDDQSIIGKDKFKKTESHSKTANLFFLVNEARVRGSELSGADLNGLKQFIIAGITEGYVFKSMNVSAYASPDGELTINTNLAENRATAASKAITSIFKKLKVADATKENFFTKVTTAEDWDGFKTAMEASSIPDKELILRVLTMYPDGETREKEIKNLAATYTEVAEIILPQLRRAVFTLNAEKLSKSDEEITALVTSNPDSLTTEEILYAATLTNDVNAKLDIYKKAEAKYANDWRTSNNVGHIYLIQNKLNEAAAQFKKADALSVGNPIIKNNLGIIARLKGDRTAAMTLYGEAAGAGPEVAYNKGLVEIQNGNYAEAAANFGDATTFNAALAKLLNGATIESRSTVDSSPDKGTALAFYLKAISGAREGKVDIAVTNLKAAILKDASFKEKAADDAEFIKFNDDAKFKEVVGKL